jgi:ABC-type molybdate transport system substrate-binding protein
MKARIMLLVGFLALSIAPARAEEAIRLFAAGSLQGALSDAARAFSAESGIGVETHFGPSGMLREEIERGAPASLFASADMGNPQALAAARRTGPVVLFTRNRMCALARPGIALTPDTVLDRILDPAIKLGTSTPRSDPGGDYAWLLFRRAEAIRPGARAILEAKALQLVGGPSSPPVPAGRNAVAFHLAEGHADIFLAYCTSGQAAASELPGLQIVALPEALAVAADYGLTVRETNDPAESAAAARLALFILSARGQAILADYGFVPVTRPAE